MIEHFKTT